MKACGKSVEIGPDWNPARLVWPAGSERSLHAQERR